MFLCSKKINFFDCDPAGILFYARIYELCHSTYEALIESFNLKEDYWKNETYVVPIISSEASYLKPIKYGEEIAIELEVSLLKQSSFELKYICKNIKGEECAHVKTVHVFVNKKTWAKMEMNQEIKRCFEKHLRLHKENT